MSKSDPEAVARLQDEIPDGSELHTILRHVSRSGKQRVISVLLITPNPNSPTGVDVCDWSWAAADALGRPFDHERNGIKVAGFEMDMGFHLVYQLGGVLEKQLTQRWL